MEAGLKGINEIGQNIVEKKVNPTIWKVRED